MDPHQGQFPKLKLDKDQPRRRQSTSLFERIETARDGQQEAKAKERPLEVASVGGAEHKAATSVFCAAGAKGDGIATQPTILEEPPQDVSDDAVTRPTGTQGSAIAFHPKVTSASGNSTPLQGAESAGTTPPIRDCAAPSRAAWSSSLSGSSIWAEQELDESADETKIQSKQVPRSGETRKILLRQSDATPSAGSCFSFQDRVASLTSGTTSPSFDEARTPLEGDGDYIGSTIATNSPVEFPAFQNNITGGSWPWRSPSQRALARPASLRKGSRRSSARSSASPASAFLSQWSRSNSQHEMDLPKPDSEGQEIAGSGYIIGKQVGRGAFSTIKEVHGFEDGIRVTRAVKIVRKNIDGADEAENEKMQGEFDREVTIWRYLKHAFILPLLVVFDSPFATFCITHLNSGGTLLDVLASHQKRKRAQTTRSSSPSHATTWGGSSFSSARVSSSLVLPPRSETGDIPPAPVPGLPVHLARRYLYQLASALRYLHEDVRVVHRDVKPDNCLIDMSGANSAAEGGNLLLCDFGLAEFISSDVPEPTERRDSAKSANDPSLITGSVNYVSPETIETGVPIFSPTVDMWAFGVVAYSVLVGALPFSHDLRPVLMQKIKAADYDVNRLHEACDAYDFEDELGVAEMITGCLEPGAAKRLTVGDVLQCTWFDGAEDQYRVQRAWLDA